METQQIVVLIVGVLVLSAFTFIPQWQAKRRREKRMSQLHVGDQVMTVGGFIGKLTYLSLETNRARIELAPGVEIEIVAEGISRSLTPSETQSEPEPE